MARESELHVVHAGADGLRAVGQHGNVEAGRHPLPQFRQKRVDAIDGVDDVGIALLGDDEQDRRVVVVPAGGAAVAHAGANGSDVRQPDDRAIRGLYDQRIIFVGVAQLIVDADGDGTLAAVKSPDRTGGVGIGNRRAHVFHGQTHGGEPRRIDAHADGGLLGTGDRDIGNPVDLRQALGDHAVGRVVDFAGLHRLGCQRQDQDRRRRRVGFAECRQRRQVSGQIAQRGVERGLHVARGTLDAAAQIKLHGDA